MRTVSAPWSIATDARAREPYDAVRTQALRLLHECGAADVAHLGGDLLSHLVRTEVILREWEVADLVALAGLCHAAYGTDGFAPSLLPLTERDRLAAAIGAEAEALVYLYACCDRAAVYRQLGSADVDFRDRFTGGSLPADATWLARFAELTAANELELIRSRAFADQKVIAELAGLFEALTPYAPEHAAAAAAEARAALTRTD